MNAYNVQLENTVEELQELFVTRYSELMECDTEWAKEVQEMECTNPHTKDDVETTLKQLCQLNDVTYTI